MATNAVDIQGVSKRFRLYHQKYTSLKERVIHAGRTPYTDLWALRDVVFQVKEGETVGILGRNGSGKSTLLKCVCGVLQPTEGQVVVRGRLAGLLELGAGFQADLTGRQNIYLNGSLLGLAKSNIDKIFDEIVAFAELEQFIDQQVKFYSSGMYVRLGFAVAVNVDPDVLVIDEVLAVGDERFQRKCLDRVQSFQHEGRTIIFVSHSPDLVRAICDRVLVLNDGHVVGHGPPGEAVRIFREHLLEAGDVLSMEREEEAEPDDNQEVGPGGLRTDRMHPIRISGVTAEHPGTGERPYLITGEPLTITLHFSSVEPTSTASFVVEFRNESGAIVLRTVTGDLAGRLDVPGGTGSVTFHYGSFPFLDGAYDIGAGVEHGTGGQLYDWKDSAAKVEVMSPTKARGMVEVPVTISLSVDGTGPFSGPVVTESVVSVRAKG